MSRDFIKYFEQFLCFVSQEKTSTLKRKNQLKIVEDDLQRPLIVRRRIDGP